VSQTDLDCVKSKYNVWVSTIFTTCTRKMQFFLCVGSTSWISSPYFSLSITIRKAAAGLCSDFRTSEAYSMGNRISVSA